MQEYDGRISLGTDGWTLPNHRAYIAYTAHWEEDGKPVSCILDFCELAKVRLTSIPHRFRLIILWSHDGETLAELTELVVREFGIENKARL